MPISQRPHFQPFKSQIPLKEIVALIKNCHPSFIRPVSFATYPSSVKQRGRKTKKEIPTQFFSTHLYITYYTPSGPYVLLAFPSYAATHKFPPHSGVTVTRQQTSTYPWDRVVSSSWRSTPLRSAPGVGKFLRAPQLSPSLTPESPENLTAFVH